jgi:hypothetical protein
MQGEIDVLEVVSDRGREINAALQADTLVALMIPHPINLAHDGAVLVQNFRIARAGVICPLTQRDRLDPSFGTRHRGAIGVSEETDALVVVVSEERGEIRVVHRGEISEARPPPSSRPASPSGSISRASRPRSPPVPRSAHRQRRRERRRPQRVRPRRHAPRREPGRAVGASWRRAAADPEGLGRPSS